MSPLVVDSSDIKESNITVNVGGINSSTPTLDVPLLIK